MTPLFPLTDNAPLFIRQGRTGDCYLLASLDCIYNSGKEMRDNLKARFKELTDENGQKDGRIEVRLNHNNHSKNIKPEKEYTHTVENVQGVLQDVFIINAAKVREIDQPNEYGAETNSLAVKILERLAVQYYQVRSQALTDTTLKSHSEKGRYNDSATNFVAKLLGLNSHEFDKIEDAINIKQVDPEAVIYISKQCGETNQGEKHAYHAYRIDQIVPNNSGSYDFILLNPWNKVDIVPIEKIKDQKFCIFSITPVRYQLTKTLIRLGFGDYIRKNPGLFNALLELKEQGKISAGKSDLEETNNFLSAIIAWVKKSSSFNKKALLELAITMAVKQKQRTIDPNLLKKIRAGLAMYLWTNNTNRLTIGPALEENTPSKEIIESILEVRAGLAMYLLTNNTIHLTRSGSLRALFEQDLLSKKVIQPIFSKKQLLAIGINCFDKNDKNLKNFIREQDETVADTELFNILLDDLTKKDSETVFEKLNQIQEINPSLAKALINLAEQHFSQTNDQKFKQKTNDSSKVEELKKQGEVDEAKRIAEAKSSWRRDINAMLSAAMFTTHLNNINLLKNNLKQRADKYPDDDLINDAAVRAQILYDKLCEAKANLLNYDPQQPVTKEAAFVQFKQACSSAIEHAMPTLVTHRGWKQAFADILNVIAAIGSLGIANLATGRFRLFDVQTKSEKIVENFRQTLN